jgi:hypothetical protein
MSNKLILAGLATVAMVATSLVNVASSQAQVAVGGNTLSVGSYPGGIQTGATSTSLATGKQSGAVSGSMSATSPYMGGSSTVAGASTRNLVAGGTTNSAVGVGRYGAGASAGAAAGNNGLGTTFTNTGTNVLSIPGIGKAAAGGSFGSIGY